MPALWTGAAYHRTLGSIESGTVRKEKKPRHTRWSKYTEEVEGKLTNLSVVRRSGVKRKRPPIEACPEPNDGSRTRWVGLGEEPEGLTHGSAAALFQDGDDMAEVEKICKEKKVRGGMDYLVRWKGFDASYDEWVNEADIMGLGNLLQTWKERNKRVAARMERKEEEVARPIEPVNRGNPTVGSALAILSPNGANRPFYLAKVLKVNSKTIKVHWYNNKKVDGTYTLEYGKKKGKGVGKPKTATLYRTTIVDTVASVKGLRGRIEREELTRILALVKQARRKK
jgi:hypothetical protein